jgi:hypothetical protein
MKKDVFFYLGLLAVGDTRVVLAFDMRNKGLLVHIIHETFIP